ncbi:YT521-B-like domain-containing protein [Gautieria morchelliformis]|nr:YT521-B-like domain-containing protein [Gautieria morchelliformis]
MASAVFHSDHVDHVSWAARSSATPGSAHRGSSPPAMIAEEDESDKGFLSRNENRVVGESPRPVTPDQEDRLRVVVPDKNFLSPSENRLVGESPMPVTPGMEANLKAVRPPNDEEPTLGLASAPPEPHQPHRRISHPTFPREPGTYPERPQNAGDKSHLSNVLSETPRMTLRLPPPRAATAKHNTGKPLQLKGADGVLRMDTYGSDAELRRVFGVEAANALESCGEREQGGEDRRGDRPEGWGREFKIEWLRAERLPFHRTRHLRNPWNHDREVKVSRDGTELEPGVGQKLLDEWDAAASQAGASPPTSPGPGRGRASRSSSKAGGTVPASSPAPVPALSSQVQRLGFDGAGRGRGTRQA